jgi:hypothetical protein
MVVYLEMTTRDVTLFSMFYIYIIPSEVHFSVNCANQYPLSEQFHLMRMPHRCPVLQSKISSLSLQGV